MWPPNIGNLSAAFLLHPDSLCNRMTSYNAHLCKTDKRGDKSSIGLCPPRDASLLFPFLGLQSYRHLKARFYKSCSVHCHYTSP